MGGWSAQFFCPRSVPYLFVLDWHKKKHTSKFRAPKSGTKKYTTIQNFDPRNFERKILWHRVGCRIFAGRKSYISLLRRHTRWAASEVARQHHLILWKYHLILWTCRSEKRKGSGQAQFFFWGTYRSAKRHICELRVPAEKPAIIGLRSGQQACTIFCAPFD